MLATPASPPATNLPFEDFATPPPAPDMLGPCAFRFNGDPNDLVELMRVSNAEVQVNYQKAVQGLVCSSAAPIVSRALTDAGPLVTRELAGVLRAGLR